MDMIRLSKEAMQQAALMAELTEMLLHLADNDIDSAETDEDGILREERMVVLDEIDRIETAIRGLGRTGVDTDVAGWLEAQVAMEQAADSE